MSEVAQIKTLIEEQGRAWEQFKATNDERLKQLEKAGGADAALVTHMENLNSTLTNLGAQVTQLENQLNRPEVGGDKAGSTPQVKAHAAAFNKFMRKGVEAGLPELAIQAAVSTGVDADGGHAVPEELDRMIIQQLGDVSPMRQLANVASVGAGYKKLSDKRGTASGWVGETDARAATATAQIADVTPTIGEIYAFPLATQRSLDDVFFNVEQWLAGGVSTEFAEKEGVAFVLGDAADKPKGFLTYTTSLLGDGTRTFGEIQRIHTGAAGAFAAADPADKLIDVVQSTKPALRQGASWLMNALTTGAVRKLKDEEGNYLWRPGLELGKPNVLLGYAQHEDEAMPDIAADALAIAFGNWKVGYLILDVMGTRVLRDPFTQKPYIGFYTTKRVGGGVVQDQAIKLVQFSV